MASRYEKFITQDWQGGNLYHECIFCGQVWQIMGGSRMPRGSFICPNGCTQDYDEALNRYNKILFKRNPITGKYEPYKKTVEVENEK